MKPKLRFKEFSDEWEEKKLGDIAEKIQRGASPRPISDKKWFDSKSSIGWIRISDITRSGKYIYSVEQKLSKDGISKSRFLEANNLILSIAATIGKPVINKIPVCIHDGFVVFKNILPLNDIEFLYYYLLYIRPNWFRYQQPGSQFNLNSDLVKNQNIFLPSFPEQEKIGQFLSLVDKRIEKQEKRIELLKERKKGWMQKIFNQEIRFKDENGNDYSDWEEKKLGDIAKLSDGDWIEANHIFENGKYRIIQTGNIGIGNFIDKNAKYFHQEDFDELKANEIFASDILISRLAEPVGRSIIVPNLPQRMVTAVDVAIIRPSDLFNTYYLVSYLNTNQNINNISILATGSTRKRISRKNLEKIVIPFPSLPEQEKIAGFLSKQDELIEQEEKKLELLKEQKKGLLQQMFV